MPVDWGQISGKIGQTAFTVVFPPAIIIPIAQKLAQQWFPTVYREDPPTPAQLQKEAESLLNFWFIPGTAGNLPVKHIRITQEIFNPDGSPNPEYLPLLEDFINTYFELEYSGQSVFPAHDKARHIHKIAIDNINRKDREKLATLQASDIEQRKATEAIAKADPFVFESEAEARLYGRLRRGDQFPKSVYADDPMYSAEYWQGGGQRREYLLALETEKKQKSDQLSMIAAYNERERLRLQGYYKNMGFAYTFKRLSEMITPAKVIPVPPIKPVVTEISTTEKAREFLLSQSKQLLEFQKKEAQRIADLPRLYSGTPEQARKYAPDKLVSQIKQVAKIVIERPEDFGMVLRKTIAELMASLNLSVAQAEPEPGFNGPRQGTTNNSIRLL